MIVLCDVSRCIIVSRFLNQTKQQGKKGRGRSHCCITERPLQGWEKLQKAHLRITDFQKFYVSTPRVGQNTILWVARKTVVWFDEKIIVVPHVFEVVTLQCMHRTTVTHGGSVMCRGTSQSWGKDACRRVREESSRVHVTSDSDKCLSVAQHNSEGTSRLKPRRTSVEEPEGPRSWFSKS